VDAFFDTTPSHLHLARVRVGAEAPREHVIVLERRDLALEPGAETASESPGSGFFDFFRLGVEHIATGIDHLVFLLGLLLAGRSLAQVAGIVTGFTAAHSVTLGLGVLGVIRPDSSAIEALIGLSIAIVALENFAETVGPRLRGAIWAALGLGLAAALAGSLAGRVAVPGLTIVGVGLFTLAYAALVARAARPERLRWGIAFVFGLIHGFGFAGALAETALPSGRLASALFGFNLGVEAGQLVIVAAAWPLLRALARGSDERRAAWMQIGSTPVLAAGLFWFLSRALER
jgi:hypothetical protein